MSEKKFLRINQNWSTHVKKTKKKQESKTMVLVVNIPYHLKLPTEKIWDKIPPSAFTFDKSIFHVNLVVKETFDVSDTIISKKQEDNFVGTRG